MTGSRRPTMLKIPSIVLLGALLAASLASTAAASAPQTGTFSGPVVFDDFFGNDPPGGPHCAFPVLGSWQAEGHYSVYAQPSGGTRELTFISFAGTLSNPITGKSVPDAGIIKLTDDFAPDGTLLQEVEHHTRFDNLLHAAFLTVTDRSGAIVFDKGRDWLNANAHPISIVPLCDALG
jgi:hypothetical protein